AGSVLTVSVAVRPSGAKVHDDAVPHSAIVESWKSTSLHTKPCSAVQVEEQPSPFATLPSSQSSNGGRITPSLHVASQASPAPSPSPSVWSGLTVIRQLSVKSRTPS